MPELTHEQYWELPDDTQIIYLPENAKHQLIFFKNTFNSSQIRIYKVGNEYILKKSAACVFCGTRKGTTKHHVVPQRLIKKIQMGDFWPDPLANIMMLCWNCHLKYHQEEPKLEDMVDYHIHFMKLINIKFLSPLYRGFNMVRKRKL